MTVRAGHAPHRIAVDASPEQPNGRRAWLTLLVAGAFIALWPLLLRRFGGDAVYGRLGLYGIAILIVMSALGWRRRRVLLNASPTNLGIGFVVGIGMTVATYVAYRVGVALFPGLASHVEGLYAATRAAHVWAALTWTVLVVVAEEILWRGPLVDVDVHGPILAILVVASLASYAAVQLGTGSWVVALAALVCGGIWTAERLITRSMVAPLISHAIWTITVIHVYPVTSI
jgi:membrane protease YdiL (CAAX protease family)